MYKLISLTVITLLFFSCSKKRYFIYSPDRTQGVTIINEDDIRYVINGIHSFSVPESNFIELMITDEEFAEEVFICWKDENNGWDLVIRESKILKNTLDTNLFHFNNSLERDEGNLPSVKKFRRPGCSEISLDSKYVYPEESAIIELWNVLNFSAGELVACTKVQSMNGIKFFFDMVNISTNH